jgi:L-ascorbate metabolism protein UlaG (beta-lactamase superfamily)
MARINLGARKRLSAHFDGKIFHNHAFDPVARGLKEFVKLRLTHKRADWPKWVHVTPAPAPLARVEGDRLRVTFVNHATVLEQTQGMNFLTDPIWSHRSSPFSWIGPRRVRPAGIRLEDLPPIDAVLVSHDHYDHFDMATLKLLARRKETLFFSGLGSAELFEKAGLAGRVHEMDWWEGSELPGGVRIHYVPAQHFSGRTLWDRFERLWGGFALETPGGPVYFCGDSGYCDHFKEARERFGPFRLAILPVGAYEPRWFMGHMHMDPAGSVQASLDLQASYSIGMHYGTFQLTDEPVDGPVHDLAAALKTAGLPDRQFRLLDFGESWDIPGVQAESKVVDGA